MRTTLLFAILVAGCGNKEEAAKQAAPAPAPTEKKSPPVAEAIDPNDSCTVKLSGAATGEASRKGGSMAISSRYWMSDAEKQQLGETPAFTINCDGKSADGKAINVHLIAPADDSVPMKPGTYIVGGKDGKIHRLVSVDRHPIKANGQIDITEFDRNHLEGTFKLEGENLEKQVFTLDGTFDLKCHGTKCG
jgi:hypothetical protein